MPRQAFGFGGDPREGTCTHIADWLHCTAETAQHCKAVIFQLKKWWITVLIQPNDFKPYSSCLLRNVRWRHALPASSSGESCSDLPSFPGREQPHGVLEDNKGPGERRDWACRPHTRGSQCGVPAFFLPGFSDERVIHGGNSPGPLRFPKTQEWEFLTEEGSWCLTILLCLLL